MRVGCAADPIEPVSEFRWRTLVVMTAFDGVSPARMLPRSFRMVVEPIVFWTLPLSVNGYRDVEGLFGGPRMLSTWTSVTMKKCLTSHCQVDGKFSAPESTETLITASGFEVRCMLRTPIETPGNVASLARMTIGESKLFSMYT